MKETTTQVHEHVSEKERGLVVNLILYILAFLIGQVPFVIVQDLFLAEAAFTFTATAVIFIATCIYADTSLYDPYWSVAPPVMLLIAMIKYHLWNINALLMLFVILIWAIRLTRNWAYTYKGIGHEDWRYANYRIKLSKAGFVFINLVGLQYVPTIVVYAGMINAFFVAREEAFSLWMIPGLLVMLGGVVLEYISDTSIHQFLHDHAGEHITCNISIWKYSRHPNYLGEMLFWTGMFLVFFSVRSDIWYYGLGFLLIIFLFLFVSIPMMEKHNLERRSDYKQYQARTSRLLILPMKKQS